MAFDFRPIFVCCDMGNDCIGQIVDMVPRTVLGEPKDFFPRMLYCTLATPVTKSAGSRTQLI